MQPVLAATVVVALVLGMAVAVRLRLRSRGKGGKVTRAIWLMMGVQSLVAGVCVWAFATGRPGIAIGVLIALFVLPEFVLMPLRIRRSSAAARAARERRRGR
jgi:ABC-type sugar transport system permease subunit